MTRTMTATRLTSEMRNLLAWDRRTAPRPRPGRDHRQTVDEPGYTGNVRRDRR